MPREPELVSSEQLMDHALQIQPRLSYDDRKGSWGRVCVIGGCEFYTGAPYFAAAAALRIGTDYAYVVTTKGAAPAIKSYSPELIVMPCLPSTNEPEVRNREHMLRVLGKAHSVVLGPGLGRDPVTLDYLRNLAHEVLPSLEVPVIIDADGILLVDEVWIGKMRSAVVITPNWHEASLLKGLPTLDGQRDVFKLVKGKADRLSCAGYHWAVSEVGAPRRVAGLGDVLSGVLGALLAWTTVAEMPVSPRTILLGSVVLRRVACAAFEKHGRQMTPSTVIEAICESNMPWTPI
ncbi:MAG: uncharacterized protein KVP18_001774 [Porospora cf. gigantea A]|uniref:uncharacterized protein n=2 Tax=Porospora cf. gigantea A TaxID=2853593 RepID=UPI0035598E7C|nr:MAG: hypothetical protein KVP18_001774 [Porospora cf. gigantea A]